MQVELVKYTDMVTESSIFKHLIHSTTYTSCGFNVFEDDNYLVLASSDKELLYEGVVKITKSSIIDRKTIHIEEIENVKVKTPALQKLREIKKQNELKKSIPAQGTIKGRQRDYFKIYGVSEETFRQLYLDPSNNNKTVATLLNQIPEVKDHLRKHKLKPLSDRRVSEMASQAGISKHKSSKPGFVNNDFGDININMLLIEWIDAGNNNRKKAQLKTKYGLNDKQWAMIKKEMNSRRKGM